MTPWQQLYCTHCTYRTSYLHQRNDDVAEQSFEYSVRAGSIPAESSHDVFRSLESAMYYDVPADTPADDLLERTPQDTPPRLIWFPDLNGFRVIGQLRYRQLDTQGRPGSYFGHFLVQSRNRSEAANSNRAPVARLLQLWGNSGWQCEDGPDLPFSLPVVQDPCAWSREPPLLDDALLHTFLTADESDPRWHAVLPPVPWAGAGLIPGRWRSGMTAAERREWMVRVIDGILHIGLPEESDGTSPDHAESSRNAGGRRGLAAGRPDANSTGSRSRGRQQQFVVAAEPGVIALLFYGAFRLLPELPALQQLSLSTLESHYTRPSTSLAGVTFCEPSLCELLPETFGSRGLGLNTYSGRMSDVFQAEPASDFSRYLVDSFAATEASAVSTGLQAAQLPLDAFRAQLAAERVTSWPALNRSAGMDREIRRYLQSDGQAALSDDVARDRQQRRAVGHRLARLWSGPSQNGRDELKVWARSPQAVPALELLSESQPSQPEIAQERDAVIKRFLRHIPADAAARAVGRATLEPRWRARLLARVFHETQALPHKGAILIASRETGITRSVVELYCQALATALSPDDLRVLGPQIPPPSRSTFARCLLRVAAKDPARLTAVVELAQQLNGDDLAGMLRDPKAAKFLLSACRQQGVPAERIVGRIAGLLPVLTADPRRFETRLRGLLAFQRFLPDRERSDVARWEDLRHVFDRVTDPPTDQDVDFVFGKLRDVLPELQSPQADALNETASTVQSVLRAVAPTPARGEHFWQAVEPRLWSAVLEVMRPAAFRRFLLQADEATLQGNFQGSGQVLGKRVASILDMLLVEPDQAGKLVARIGLLAFQLPSTLLERVHAWQKIVECLQQLKQLHDQARYLFDLESRDEAARPLYSLARTAGREILVAASAEDRRDHRQLLRLFWGFALEVTGGTLFQDSHVLNQGFQSGVRGNSK